MLFYDGETVKDLFELQRRFVKILSHRVQVITFRLINKNQIHFIEIFLYIRIKRRVKN